MDPDPVIAAHEIEAGLHQTAVINLSRFLCLFLNNGCETRLRKLNRRLWLIAFGLCGDVRRNINEKRILLGVVER